MFLHRMEQPKSTLKPFWKFSSFYKEQVQYQCYQKCMPMVPNEPHTMVEMCNKICPFKTDIPECAGCAQIYALLANPHSTDVFTQPESLMVEPNNHMIIFNPEIVVVGSQRKQCCYLDQCEIVAIDDACETRCYEPCDMACTGRCFINPQCPNRCEAVRQEQFRIKYKIWLVQKLNEIKKKYRAMATACLLKTRLAFVNEVQNLSSSAKEALAAGGKVNSNIQDEVEQINPDEYPAIPDYGQAMPSEPEEYEDVNHTGARMSRGFHKK